MIGTNKIRLCFLILVALSYKTFVYAQIGEDIRKHVIVAIDTRPGFFVDSLKDSILMTKKLTNILSEIVNDSDYVSVVDYGMPSNASSFNQYTTSTVEWKTYGDFKKSLPQAWNKIAYMKHYDGMTLFSMLTGGKIYSFLQMNELKKKNSEKASNKIYMLMLDDNQYNGNDDYNKEFQRYKENNSGSRLTEREFRSTGIKVTKMYSFIWDREYTIAEKYDEKYYATLYEVVPNDRPSLPSAVVYPANLGLQRIRGGYELDFDYYSALPSYKVKKLSIESIKNAPNNTDVDGIVFSENFIGKDGHVNIFIDSKRIGQKTLNVVMRVWLEKTDNIYSGLVLSPYDKDCENLTVAIELPLKDDAMILGLLPMPDLLWWWFPTNQSKAVLIWDVVFVLLFVAIVCFVAYRLLVLFSAYHPSNKKIKITHL